MRRIIVMAVASSALALAAPGVASAHHHSRHHSRTHHARKARFRHFGALARTTAPTPGAPVAPVTPAGTVKSFNEGVLTITLGDGSTVSGKVTEDTDIVCVKPGTENGDDDQGDDHSGAFMSDHHGDQSGDDQGDDDQGDDNGEAATCTTAALVPGAVVLGAELRIGSSGAVWKDLVLSS